MKIYNYLLIFTLAIAVSSCKKSKTEDPEPESVIYKATISGSSWTAKDYTVSYRNEIFVISGTSANGETVILRMKLVAGHETDQAFYQFMYNDDNSVGLYIEKANDAEFGTNQFDGTVPTPGTISFTKLDKSTKKVSGTFKIKVKRKTDNAEKNIEGSFENVIYDDKIPPVPTKTMTANIDTTGWTANTVLASSDKIAKVIKITGKSLNGSSIVLTVPYKVLASTFNVALFGSRAAQYNPTTSTEMKGETGTITITFHDPDDKVIKGSFAFTASDMVLGQKSINKGNFVAVY